MTYPTAEDFARVERMRDESHMSAQYWERLPTYAAEHRADVAALDAVLAAARERTLTEEEVKRYTRIAHDLEQLSEYAARFLQGREHGRFHVATITVDEARDVDVLALAASHAITELLGTIARLAAPGGTETHEHSREMRS